MFKLSSPKTDSSTIKTHTSNTEAKYVVYDVSKIDNIKLGSFIKYKKKDCNDTVSGFLNKVIKTDDNDVMCYLTAPPNRKWRILLSHIEEIYVKQQDEDAISKDDITPKKDDLHLLLHKRIDILEHEVLVLKDKIKSLIEICQVLNKR